MADIVQTLKLAYADEIETVANYIALSTALDGVKAQEVKEALAEDVDEELGHARQLAQRLKEIGEIPPGSLALDFQQRSLQPPSDTTNVRAVVEGVLDAEEKAVQTYRSLIEASQRGNDPVTKDLAIKILADEEKHRSLFRGYLKELEAGTGAKREQTPARRA